MFNPLRGLNYNYFMSANYNFLNVDSNEFEQICAEILSIYLNKEFRTFAPGPDGGVDIKQNNGSEEIIGQAKRYKNSSSLILNDELSKIESKPDCKKYYLFTSCQLSPDKRKDIFNKFSKYMDDESFIFDSISLNALLDKDEYDSVLRKHFRLWATSERIVNLLMANSINIDTNELISSIKRHLKYYVETSEYHQALQLFEKERVILIKGDAGVGKTTTSEMLVLNFLNKYPSPHFVYSSSGNIESLKDALSNNPETTELVFIDDFLGDIYLSLKGDNIKSIASFISHFKNSPNKFLIINTRVVILEESRNRFIDFRKTLDDIGVKQIQLSNLSKKDKSLILYNHIYFSDISDDDKKMFLEKKLYKTIVEHPHYSPRLIETICNKKQFELSGLSFEKYTIDILTNQSDTWEHAFTQNLDVPDRVLLIVLYSFGSTRVRVNSLEKAFVYEAKKRGDIDLSVDVFNQSLKRLSGAFVNIQMIYSIKYCGFINPSVKDCVSKHIYFDKQTKFVFFDQYLKVNGEESFLKSKRFYDMVKNNETSLLATERYNQEDILCLFFNCNIVLDSTFEDMYLKAVSSNMQSSYIKLSDYYLRDIFKQLTDDNYINFYNLSNLCDDDLLALALNCFANLTVDRILDVLNKVDNSRVENILQNEDVKNAIIDYCYDDYDKSSAIEYGMFDEGDEDEHHIYFDEDLAKEHAVDDLYDEISDTFVELSNRYSFDIDKVDIDCHIDSNDFRRDYEAQAKPYDRDDYFGEQVSNDDCYDIFKNIIR